MISDLRFLLLRKLRDKKTYSATEFISIGLSVYQNEPSIRRASQYLVSVGLLKINYNRNGVNRMIDSYEVTERDMSRMGEPTEEETKKILREMEEPNPCGSRDRVCYHGNNCYMSINCKVVKH